MNILSAILRFLCGLALIIASYATYHRVKGQINASDSIQIAGISIGASPREVSWGLGVVALLGFLLIILGVVTLLKKRS